MFARNGYVCLTIDSLQLGEKSWQLPDDMRIAVRSAGADGSFDTTTYQVGPFVATDYSQDIVWAGGFFIRWPDSSAAAATSGS